MIKVKASEILNKKLEKEANVVAKSYFDEFSNLIKTSSEHREMFGDKIMEKVASESCTIKEAAVNTLYSNFIMNSITPEEYVEHMANSILGDTIEKIAKPKKGRIDAFTEYYSTEPYVNDALDRNDMRNRNRVEQAEILDQIKSEKDKDKKNELKNQLKGVKKDDKKLRNDQLKHNLNLPKAFNANIHGIKNLAKSSPVDAIIPTPGYLVDMIAAQNIVLENRAKNKK